MRETVIIRKEPVFFTIYTDSREIRIKADKIICADRLEIFFKDKIIACFDRWDCLMETR